MKKEAEAKKVRSLCLIGSHVHAYMAAPLGAKTCAFHQHHGFKSADKPVSFYFILTPVHNLHVQSAELNLQAAEDREVAKILEQAQRLPRGQKKDYGAEMLKGYDPKYVEAAT